MHQRLRHPNVLRLHAWFHDEAKIYLVLEYAPEGDLFGLLDKEKAKKKGKGDAQEFEESVLAGCVVQVAKALGYAHEMEVMHRGTYGCIYHRTKV